MNRPFGATLHPSERDILALAAEGLTNFDIGLRRGTTEQTIKKQLRVARAKIGAESTLHAIALMDDYRTGWRPRLPFPEHAR